MFYFVLERLYVYCSKQKYEYTMKSVATIAFAALASQAMAKTFQVALTGYYNGIDTIGGSGSTAHFK